MDRLLEMRISHRRIGVGLLLLAGLAGCSEVVGLGESSGIMGTFAVVDVDGEPLPVTGTIQGHPTQTTLLADTLVLMDRTWSRVTYVRSGAVNQPGSLDWDYERAGYITRQNDGRFVLAFDCNDVGDCAPAEAFEARGDTLLIARSSDYYFENLRLVRVR